MAWSVRIQQVSYKGLGVLFGGALLWIIVAVLLGAFGPQVLNVNRSSAYQCPNGEHYNFDPKKCKGVQPAFGAWVNITQEWSKQYMNRHWYLDLVMYLDRAYPQGINGKVTIWVMMRGSNYRNSWTLLVSQNNTFNLKCSGGSSCGSIVYTIDNSENNFKSYQFSFRFTDENGTPLLPLADVDFKFEYESSGFATISIALRLIYLILSVLALGYLVKRQRDDFKFSPVEWSREVQILAVLLVLLSLANNPFYFLVFIGGAFFQYVDAFFELIFMSFLVLFWYYAAMRLRLQDDEEITVTRYHLIKLGTLGLYTLLGFLQIVLVVSLNETAPMFTIMSYPTGILILFIFTSVLFGWIVSTFYWDLYHAWVNATDSRTTILLVYLAIPSALVALAQFVGVILGYVAVFNRPAPMFYFVISVYNVYILYLVWAFWPEKTEVRVSSSSAVSDSERSGLLSKIEDDSKKPHVSSAMSSPLHDGDDVL